MSREHKIKNKKVDVFLIEGVYKNIKILENLHKTSGFNPPDCYTEWKIKVESGEYDRKCEIWSKRILNAINEQL